MTVPALRAQSFLRRVEALAEDVGRIRRRLEGDEYGLHVICRVAGHVDYFDAFFRPTAAEIYAANLRECGDPEESVAAALEDVDRRMDQLRVRLGEAER